MLHMGQLNHFKDRCCQNYPLYQKMLQIKVVENYISYKKLSWHTCLCSPGVELGGSKDCHVSNTSVKPAAVNYQNRCEHILWLSHKKKVHAWELPTRVSQLVLFSHAIIFSQENWETESKHETTSQSSHQIIYLWMWILKNGPLSIYRQFLSGIQWKFSENMQDVCSLVITHIFLWENTFDFAKFTASSARDARNLSCEVTTTKWINLYVRFTSCMFSYCKHVSTTSLKSSVPGLIIPKWRK